MSGLSENSLASGSESRQSGLDNFHSLGDSVTSHSEALDSLIFEDPPPAAAGGSNAFPTNCNDSKVSLVSEESPRSVAESSSASMATSTRHSHEGDISRLQELESKRASLRSQRFSLEQRLYEFCGKQPSPESASTTKDVSSPPEEEGSTSSASKQQQQQQSSEPQQNQHVLDFGYTCPTTGVRVLYSGPLNGQKQPHGSNCIMKFVDGQVYKGDTVSGKRHGSGTNTWPDGQQYSGEVSLYIMYCRLSVI